MYSLLDLGSLTTKPQPRQFSECNVLCFPQGKKRLCAYNMMSLFWKKGSNDVSSAMLPSVVYRSSSSRTHLYFVFVVSEYILQQLQVTYSHYLLNPTQVS
jgi:hypothetical protein